MTTRISEFFIQKSITSVTRNNSMIWNNRSEFELQPIQFSIEKM